MNSDFLKKDRQTGKITFYDFINFNILDQEGRKEL